MLNDLQLKHFYSGRGEKLLKDFLLPCLSEAIRYDRISGFFSVESLIAISHGIDAIYAKKGKIRLIIGIHSIPKEIIEASLGQEYLKNTINEIKTNIEKELTTISDSLVLSKVATIAWMISDGLLEVKTAGVVSTNSKPGGIFHPKTFIIEDQEGNCVAAIGSPNESQSGLGDNFEQIMLSNSWNDPDGIAELQSFFDSLWDDRNPETFVCDITEETEEMIRNGLKHTKLFDKNDKNTSIIEEAAKMPANFFVSGNIPALYLHQERAVIDALSRWPIRILFADEVGLGKTFEVAATLAFMMKYHDVKRVLILTPKAVLKQWQEELHTHFKIDAWIYESTHKAYVSYDGKFKTVNDCIYGKDAPNISLMSVQYARGRNKNSIFDEENTVLPEVLVVDEAHSARISNDISGKKKKTLVYKMIEKVADQIPHLIFATATPMQKDAEEYHSMLKLLGLPKKWSKPLNYNLSLKLIGSKKIPDLSDAVNAFGLLSETIRVMKPSLSQLEEKEIELVNMMPSISGEDNYSISQFVINNWKTFRSVFVKLHPGKLLTVRNTRRSLTDVGYVFPKRELKEVSLSASDKIRLFYNRVNQFINDDCFSIETILFPDRKISLGFVKSSYQQRVASSLYSCIESLKRRYVKCNELVRYIQNADDVELAKRLNYASSEMDEIEEDVGELELDLPSFSYTIDLKSVDKQGLFRAAQIESTHLNDLIEQAGNLIAEEGDPKVEESISLACKCLEHDDKVLVFSRYTDTVDALVKEYFEQSNEAFGIYTGKKSVTIQGGLEVECSKEELKSKLVSGDLRIVFCSDAASEGLNLQAARVLINVDVPWTPSRLEQRIGRIARLGQVAESVEVYNVWYPYSVEARMYHRIQTRLRESNLAVGEFPEVIADRIRQAVFENNEMNEISLDELKKIRNSYQTKALEELWTDNNKKLSTSDVIRNRLLALVDKEFESKNVGKQESIKQYSLPDGARVCLTSKPGMAESISLTSKPFNYLSIQIKDIKIAKDNNGMSSAFYYTYNRFIKYESVLKLQNNESLTENDYFTGHPVMLPNPEKLSLTYSVTGSLKNYKSMWPPKENNNES